MPINHDAVGALPVGSAPVKSSLRDLLVKRMAYVLTAVESAQDLVAVDPATGATILAIVQNGRVFYLDPDDTTTGHDGTSCLVSYEGKRYKLDDLEVPYAVLDKDLTEPPEDPQVGDAYLLVASGTGDWAGLGPLVTLTSHGWETVDLPVGRFVYVEDEDAYYHRKPNGDISAGLGVGSIAAGSLFPSHLLLGGGLVFWNVENLTISAPPGSPVEGVAYIVASGGSGAWSGWTGSIARFENGAWRRYQAVEGWRAYDKHSNLVFIFDGTNWRADVSTEVFDASGTWTKPALGTIALFFLWGGGGSGGSRATTGKAGGGGGGAFNALMMPLSALPATVGVTVGNGGAAVSGDANGNPGGKTSLSVSGIELISAYGGFGGSHAVSGATSFSGGNGGGTASGGGMATSAPVTGGSSTSAPADVVIAGLLPSGGAGGGGGDTNNAARGGHAVLSGAGGGASNVSSAGNGGTSIGGGDGGGGSVSGAPGNGQVPGGGGGGARNGNTSGAGGNGRVIVIVF